MAEVINFSFQSCQKPPLRFLGVKARPRILPSFTKLCRQEKLKIFQPMIRKTVGKINFLSPSLKKTKQKSNLPQTTMV